ncbi:hypothetical protein NARC_10209 [Candidatus Nitrosocosmicus arcticus]|uniref:Uncharacterized protein n=1 Tax=Candidatus Nitrosocosmicus arcticus TaxID=2035267 RepID=A0A557SYY2_9ARCH|nr:hypothetical protein NARC_10209 [Candidatus Nitrosocosmicus arcticus]
MLSWVLGDTNMDKTIKVDKTIIEITAYRLARNDLLFGYSFTK